MAARPRSISRFALAAITPFAILVLLLGIYPLVQVIRMSISQVDIEAGEFVWDFGTLDHFVSLAGDSQTLSSAMTTAVFLAGTVPLSVMAGTLLAVLVDRSRLFGRATQNVIVWPAILPPVVVSLMWLLGFSQSLGSINKLLVDVGLPAQHWLGSEVGAMMVIIFVDVWHWTPLVFLIVYTALKRFDPEVLEAGRVDGANDIKMLLHIILPLLRPALAAAVLVRVVMGVKAFDEMYLLTKGGPDGATTLLSLRIRNLFFDLLEFGYGSAFSVVVVTVVALGLLLVSLLSRRKTRASEV